VACLVLGERPMGFLLPAPRRENLSGWTFFSMASIQPIYVVMSPPGQPQSPLPLTLAGMPSEHVQALRFMRRGDPVPPAIVASLLALAPRAVVQQQLGQLGRRS
jgi:hypothetical protein